MNDDLNQFTIEHELQVRLLNLVVDEASDYDRDQLMHLMEQRPELKLYVEHLQHMHGLLVTVGAGDWDKEPAPETNATEWKLPEDRRNKLLAILDGRAAQEAPTKTVTLATPIVKNKRLSFGIRLAVLAASVCVIATVLLLPAKYAARQSARILRFGNDVTSGMPSPYYLEDDVQYFPPNGDSSQSSAPSPPFGSPALQSMPLQQSVTVPDGGTLMLGGIKRDANGQVSRGAERVLQEEFAKENLLAYDKPGEAPRIAGDNVQNNQWDQSRTLTRDEVRDAKKDTSAENVEFFGRWFAGPTTNGPTEGTALDFVEPGSSVRERGLTAATDPKPATDGIDNLSSIAQAPAAPSSGEALGEGGNYFGTQAETPTKGYAGMGGGTGGMGGGYGGMGGAPPGGGTGGYTEAPDVALGRSVASTGEGGYGAPADAKDVFFGDLEKANKEEKFSKHTDLLEQTLEGIDIDSAPIRYPNTEAWQLLAEQRKQRYENSSSTDSPQQVDPQTKRELAELADGSLPFDDRRPTELERTIELQRLNDRLAEQESRGELTGKQSVNRLFKNNGPASGESTQMMTVSPTIIIPEEEEEKIVSQTEDRFGDATKSPSEPMYRFVAPKLEKAAESDKVMLGKELKSSLGVEAKAKQVQPAKPIAPVREIAASAEPFSTFSLHVSDVSFQLAQSALNQGQWPARATLRPEEFLNAFDYQDPTPNDSEMVACQIEQATHPFQMQRNLVRIAMKTGASGRALNMPLRLTVLLDISGSMERHDRKYAIQKAFQALASQLRDQDQITLIAFANTPRLIADRYNAEQARTLSSVIEKTPSQGGTNIEAALTLAREKAREQFVNGGQNRIVMLTDGAVNLGNADPNSLSKQIVELRNEGIAFDAAGICAQDLNDEVLEALTRQGDGRYYLINADDSTAESFSKQLAGALRPTAKNVKVQVEFNPQRVGQYRLIGFEKHQLKKEDFRNDRVDAAELAAAEAGVAMYQVEVKPDGVGDVGSVSVRFQDVSTGQMIERRWPITYNAKTPSIDATKPTMQLATAATLFALKLTGEPSSDRIDFSMLSGLVSNVPSAFANQPRVQALLTMINQARSLGEPPQVGN